MNKAQDVLLTYGEVKNLLKKCQTSKKCTEIETMKYAVKSVISALHAPVELKEKLLSFGITEFEAVQLLNAPPKKILDLYVIVEELEERLTEESIGEIIALLLPYAE
ncbi:hypothetical protein NERG_01723 [Nematocida ausubeli]|uniref:RNA polymerase Rpb4/RPC9 core domain-containing protein n=1 Tax=Nematocida ausubeli (strain ATCC PRA-371 / ERTm2) TaxID=1913371 RepID=H8ZDQ2_NEMA1|nr:hypothetical protein NERG_01723 [Nematocida ausubeli]